MGLKLAVQKSSVLVTGDKLNSVSKRTMTTLKCYIRKLCTGRNSLGSLCLAVSFRL